MLEQMIGTLTSSILKFVHTLISLIFSIKLYSVSTPKHLKSFLIENHVCVVAFTLLFAKSFFHNIIDLFYYSFITELIPFPILINGSYPSFKTLLLYKKSLAASWLL
jgi:hypothetical protein